MTFKQRRKALGYSVKDMADKLGYSPRTVEAWDGGFRTPPKNVEILMDYIEADRGLNALKKLERERWEGAAKAFGLKETGNEC